MENYLELAHAIKSWGKELGFQQTGITDTDLGKHETHLKNWLEKGFAADMQYMSKHGEKRSRPDMLIPGTIRIISARMDYLPDDANVEKTLSSPSKAYIARYALGRDYHKVLRARLRALTDRINDHLNDTDSFEFSARVFTDSAPVLEKGAAEKAGLGWIGKNTLLLNESAGSWFFLGEIYTNIPLPIDKPDVSNRCGSCSACMDVCPTRAIVAPYELDSRRCISYHTIENRGVIPIPIRERMGNRIFGCDDCQAICPWNRYAQPTAEPDFKPRNDFDSASLLSLFGWTEDEFSKNTQGSAIRRTGYDGWIRNISIALGNADYSPEILAALSGKQHTSDMVREHVDWAIQQQLAKKEVRSPNG